MIILLDKKLLLEFLPDISFKINLTGKIDLISLNLGVIGGYNSLIIIKGQPVVSRDVRRLSPLNLTLEGGTNEKNDFRIIGSNTARIGERLCRNSDP
ncbi:MAG: hypothetical protein HQK63_10455 [Desulfamplus sp.]|nr:hypothetical protein [Desulfamplus sp.]